MSPLHRRLVNLRPKAFSISFTIKSPVSVLLVPTKAGTFKKKKKNTEEGEEETEEVRVRLAAANVISMDAAVAAVLSGLDGVFTVKEEEQHTQSLLLSLGGSGYMRNKSILGNVASSASF